MCLLSGPVFALQEAAPDAVPRFQFFSGDVVEHDPDKIVVRRVIGGKPPELRTFKVTPQTKIEGTPRPRARVTVGYITTDEGEVAVRIIVRGSARKS